MREYPLFRIIPSNTRTSSTITKSQPSWSNILSNLSKSPSSSKALPPQNMPSSFNEPQAAVKTTTSTRSSPATTTSTPSSPASTTSTPSSPASSLSSKQVPPCPDMSHILFSFTQMMESYRPFSFTKQTGQNSRTARSLFTYHIRHVMAPSASQPALVHLMAAEQLYFKHGMMDHSSRRIWEARLAKVYRDLGMEEKARQIFS